MNYTPLPAYMSVDIYFPSLEDLYDRAEKITKQLMESQNNIIRIIDNIIETKNK